VNAGLLKSFLYFEDGREVSFHTSFCSMRCRVAKPTPALRATWLWLQPRSARAAQIGGRGERRAEHRHDTGRTIRNSQKFPMTIKIRNVSEGHSHEASLQLRESPCRASAAKLVRRKNARFPIRQGSSVDIVPQRDRDCLRARCMSRLIFHMS